MTDEKLSKGPGSGGHILLIDNTAKQIKRAVKRRRKEERPVFKEMKVRR